MGMGSYAVGSFVIEYKDLKKICPTEIKVIEKQKYFKNIGWDSLSRWLSWDDPDYIFDILYDCVENDKSMSKLISGLKTSEDEIIDGIFQDYENVVTDFKNAFNKKTGLTLYFDHYDSEGGDRYDNPGDKDGCIFCVDGMVQLTPAGQKFKDIVTERKWTQYG